MSSESVRRAWRRQYSPIVLGGSAVAALVVAVSIAWSHASMLGISVATVCGVAVLVALPLLLRATGLSLARHDIHPPLVPLPDVAPMTQQVADGVVGDEVL